MKAEDIAARLQAIRTSLDSVDAAVVQLREDVLVPDAPPPPPPPPPPTGKTNMYVDGAKLRAPNGVECKIRGIESMYGPTAAGSTSAWVKCNKDLGCNAIGPLPQSVNVTEFRDLLKTTRDAGLVMLFNADHMGGRSALKRPDLVSLINEFDNCIIECEIELGAGGNDNGWVSSAKAFVADLRNAGYRKQPIKVGSPDGGRNLAPALRRGKEVLDADPEKNLIFTWQAYWSTSSGWYQGLGGFSNGLAGIKQACQAAADSGLCFVVGLDAVDDVGDTGSETLMTELERLQIGWQWWVLSNGNDPNAMVSNALNASSVTARGRIVSANLKATARLAF